MLWDSCRMTDAALDRHIRHTRIVSWAAWGLVAVALIVGGVLVGARVSDLSRAETASASYTTAIHDAQGKVDAATKAVDAATDQVAKATRERDAAKLAADRASEEQAKSWDAKVESLAAAGKIRRNPLTGIGMPTPELMAELNEIPEAARDYGYKVGLLKSAETEVEDAQDALSTAEGERADARTFALAAKNASAEARDSLIITGAIAGGVLFLLLVTAAAFWIVASRAVAGRPHTD